MWVETQRQRQYLVLLQRKNQNQHNIREEKETQEVERPMAWIPYRVNYKHANVNVHVGYMTCAPTKTVYCSGSHHGQENLLKTTVIGRSTYRLSWELLEQYIHVDCVVVVWTNRLLTSQHIYHQFKWHHMQALVQIQQRSGTHQQCGSSGVGPMISLQEGNRILLGLWSDP